MCDGMPYHSFSSALQNLENSCLFILNLQKMSSYNASVPHCAYEFFWSSFGQFFFSSVNLTNFAIFFEIFAIFLISQN
jgi:hypothetical protein